MKKNVREIFVKIVENTILFTDWSKRSPKPGSFIERFVSEEDRKELEKLNAEDVNKTFKQEYMGPTIDVFSRLKQKFDKKILKR